MTDFVHPFAELAAAPYTFKGYQEMLYYPCKEIDGSINYSVPPVAGGKCDHCGTAIRHGYWFRGADGVQFVVGSSCHDKAHCGSKEDLKAMRAEMRGARREYERKAEREAREADERDTNEFLGKGRLTDAEIRANIAEKIKQDELAERAAVKAKAEASEYVGEIGKRGSHTLTLMFSTSYDTQYGTNYIESFNDENGNCILYKGSSALPVRRGETIEITATIKSHEIYRGKHTVKQTRIARPATAKLKIIAPSPQGFKFQSYNGEALHAPERVGTNGRDY